MSAIAIAIATAALVAQAYAAHFKVLHTFQGERDGGDALASMTMDDAGNLFGTTAWGGGSSQCQYGCGFVFELSPTGSGGWKETLLHRFAGGSDGAYPEATLFRDGDGNLYGTTVAGGGSAACQKIVYGAAGCGTVFKLSLTSGVWTEEVLHSFTGAGDGSHPTGGVIMDAKGNLYGTAVYAESATGCCGVVFELSEAGGIWTESVLHTFSGTDGSGPFGSLLADAAGNLYGTTAWGGNLSACPQSPGCGVAFRLAPASRGTWKYRILHTFPGGSGGQAPVGGLIRDAAGNLYGATTVGGLENFGSIFELSPTSNGWTTRVVHSFDLSRGVILNSGLIMDEEGNLYGTTVGGGAKSAGLVFKLSPTSAGGWAETVLYAFNGTIDGERAYAGLVRDAAGNLYGATELGGANCGLDPRGCGTIFEISGVALVFVKAKVTEAAPRS